MPSRYVATSQGGPWEIVEAPKPTPGANEVLINVKAVALCPLDWKQHLLGFMVEKWPVVFGSDGAGVVDAIGEGVNKFKKGDEVMGKFARATDKGGSFQEYAILDESKVAHKPSLLSFEDASSLGLGFMTAASGVYSSLGISFPFLAGGRKDGSTPSSVLVVGGSSSTGASAIQLLRLSLPDVTILTTASPKHHEHLLSLGATKAFDHSSPSLVEDIIAATPHSAGVENIFDPVNGVAGNPSLLSTLTGPKIFAELATGRNIDPKDVPMGVDFRVAMEMNVYGEQGAENLFYALGELLEAGTFRMPVPATVVGQGMDKIGGGVAQLMRGVSGTKLVVSL